MSTSWLARDRWFGIDKLDHFAWSIAFWTVLTWLVLNPWARLGWFAAGAIGVEVVQLVRFLIWVRKGRPHPYPAFADGISYKDLAWDAAGALAAAATLAKIAARAVSSAAVAFVIVAGGLSAQTIEVAKAPEFQMSGVILDTTAYDREWPMYIRPLHGFVVHGPRGDVMVFLNAARVDSLLVCIPATQRGIAHARLVIGDRDSVWWGQNFDRRGQMRAFIHWEQTLPSGDTLRLLEVWRRQSECGEGDGGLVVVFTVRRGAPR